jgi:predicted nucleic acid-binding protein
LTLYVESNFILEIALGQAELAPAERLVAAAESGHIQIAIPAFALSEPFSRVTKRIRDRNAFIQQLNSHLGQLSRSSPHRAEVAALGNIPDFVKRINDREADRLTETIARLLPTVRSLALDHSSFRMARGFQTRLDLAIEDAIMLATILADLASSQSDTHIFANRNRRHFDNPFIVDELKDFGCDLTWTFEEAAIRLGVI